MKRTFIDSQLLIGLLNPKDAFHEVSLEIVRSKKVVLLEAVRKEVRGTFLRKYNQTCIRILQIVNKVRLLKLENPEEILEFAEKELEKIIEQDKSLENFYRFIFDRIRDLIMDKDRLIEIPRYLDDYAIEILASLSHIGDEEIVVDLNEEKLRIRNEIYKIVQDVDFKQLRDLEIFCEAAVHTLEEEAELLTGDGDFYEKAHIALEKLREYGYYPKFSVELIKP